MSTLTQGGTGRAEVVILLSILCAIHVGILKLSNSILILFLFEMILAILHLSVLQANCINNLDLYVDVMHFFPHICIPLFHKLIPQQVA